MLAFVSSEMEYVPLWAIVITPFASAAGKLLAFSLCCAVGVSLAPSGAEPFSDAPSAACCRAAGSGVASCPWSARAIVGTPSVVASDRATRLEISLLAFSYFSIFRSPFLDLFLYLQNVLGMQKAAALLAQSCGLSI